MLHGLPPDEGQLCRYRQRTLGPEELLALSDYFSRHPERRPAPAFPGDRYSSATRWLVSNDAGLRVDYDELVAKLEGAMDPVRGSALDARMAGDPLLADYLADLAAFRTEMSGLPGVIHTPLASCKKQGESGRGVRRSSQDEHTGAASRRQSRAQKF